MFELEPDIEVIGEASNGLEALDKVEELHPDIVLMDVNMPGMDGMQATRKLADAYPGILVITLTMFKGEEHLREARRAGASAYVLKDAGSEVLLETIHDVMSGETPLLQQTGRPRTGSGGDIYTTRDLEVEEAESPERRTQQHRLAYHGSSAHVQRALYSGLAGAGAQQRSHRDSRPGCPRRWCAPI